VHFPQVNSKGPLTVYLTSNILQEEHCTPLTAIPSIYLLDNEKKKENTSPEFHTPFRLEEMEGWGKLQV